MILRKLKSILRVGLFLYWNISRAINIEHISPVSKDGIIYRGVKRNEFTKAEVLYQSFHEGKGFSWDKKIIYRIFSEKMIVVAVCEENNSQKFVGINIYYFNRRDVLEGTIHEGFIGVLPNFGGRGIATNLGVLSKQHFSTNGLKGLSSRVSLDNPASLQSRSKIGYKPVEKYYDSNLGVDRFYLVCEFGLKCD